mmetsp:Transcript_89922/g.160014  ORF Transcript_89922/g.160014 Transcript_89922/m.160014 type:complete len:87 (-) Transcript_89922:304-564(-)
MSGEAPCCTWVQVAPEVSSRVGKTVGSEEESNEDHPDWNHEDVRQWAIECDPPIVPELLVCRSNLRHCVNAETAQRPKENMDNLSS